MQNRVLPKAGAHLKVHGCHFKSKPSTASMTSSVSSDSWLSLFRWGHPKVPSGSSPCSLQCCYICEAAPSPRHHSCPLGPARGQRSQGQQPTAGELLGLDFPSSALGLHRKPWADLTAALGEIPSAMSWSRAIFHSDTLKPQAVL